MVNTSHPAHRLQRSLFGAFAVLAILVGCGGTEKPAASANDAPKGTCEKLKGKCLKSTVQVACNSQPEGGCALDEFCCVE